MTRTELINFLIVKHNYKSYLEIGVQTGINYRQINCLNKIGVDPDLNSKASVHLTSDEFFDTNKHTYDIIFIDGLHESKQVYKDIVNALHVLNPGGTIVCHDMIPFDEISQRVPRETKRWTGDCWKAWVRLRFERDDLTMYVIDTDCGCGIIRAGKQTTIPTVACSYEEFEKNKVELLNIITVQEFLENHED